MFAVRPMLRPQQQVVKNTPTNKLTHAIEDAYDEYKNLEKERKKVFKYTVDICNPIV